MLPFPSTHPHPLFALLFLLADFFSLSPSALGAIGTIVSILGVGIVSTYYLVSLIQKRQENKQNKNQNVFQQMVDIAEARAMEIGRLREDITRLQQDIEHLQVQLRERGEENVRLLHELQQLGTLVHANANARAPKSTH